MADRRLGSPSGFFSPLVRSSIYLLFQSAIGMALDKQLNRNLLPLEMLIEQVAVPFQPVVLDASITATNQDKRFPGNGLNGIWNGLYDGM